MSDEHKFNFSEDENSQITNEMNKEAAVEEKKDAVKKDAQGLFASLKTFLSELLDFREDTDRDATITAIKADIPFKGATAWILVCSIFVASIGLNADSTAVVIGAMLISPLMGPILGVGLSIAINDIDTLKKSLINLATMIVLSLLTAFLFFWLFPLSEDTNELMGRTRPDIRDVLIAFFGGLALIIARTKKGTIASVIFGVAIATALMPPLCTAGYGLAIGNWQFFGGAMYLFTINTIFIALATFLVLKILRFPMLKYANSAKRKRISRVAMGVAIIVMIPAIWTFLTVLNESKINRDYQAFLKAEIEDNRSLWLYDEELDIDAKTMSLYFNGEISDEMVSAFQNAKNESADLKEFELVINANKTRSADRLAESLDRAYADLDRKDNVIDGLQKQIEELQTNISNLNKVIESKNTNQNAVSFSTLSRDAKIKFSDLEYFGYAKMLESKDFINIDTVTVANVRWKVKLADSLVLTKERDLQRWLKNELKVDTVFIKRN
ncbi:putative hydrophobic protein (TIGR00271 family) [Winogradskyella eximia]|uniref:Putative hydrophobic protein (TIGR00271 family) n=1 Tax=Winogradskyella eximia TaxID=262006 RepID=A0A3D9GZ73_9FLAO|nr:DUF389 domain-containing protein [Winogradskyella eximia]RED42265.1 putative hydrophobic protein (TIGR00271 family) [Winogradskyella eximia]|tara:strand:+ start:2100 stop:3593 length:1494 start_codon:yes stop_codon:yes gene_type:complete